MPMNNFKYTALDGFEKKTSGYIAATDKIEAVALLRKRDLIPISIKKISFTSKSISLNNNQILVFTKQLAALLASGTSIEHALLILKNESTNNKVVKLADSIIHDLTSGNALSVALSKHPKIFDQIYVSSIKAGENSASLDKVFNELSSYLEKQYLAQSQLQSALVYPILLLVVSLGVIYALVSIVLPQVVEQFISTNIELPLITKILLNLSDIFPFIFGSLGFVIALSILFYNSKFISINAKTFIAKLFLKSPIFGNLILFSQTSRFCASMHLMLSAGLNTVDGLAIAKNTFTNQYLKKDFTAILSKVKRGQSLSNAFSSSNVFPSVFKQLLSSGDIGNQVATMFLNIRDYLEQEVDTKKNIILTLLQPLVILFMGGFVMLIVLSIMLPLLQMNNLIFSI